MEVIILVPYNLKVNEIIEFFNTNEDKGLKSIKINELLLKFGKNKLQETKRKGPLERFFLQLRDPMILILLFAALVSFFIALREANYISFFEPGLILLIVFVNIIIGTMQENKAEKALQALKDMSCPNAKVIRDGKETIINAEDLVPGDIIKIEAGDFVPADARVISSFSLKCEESTITGESTQSKKNALETFPENTPIGDRKNMIHSGCPVTYGSGKAVVTSTGMHTEIGKISKLLSGNSDSSTPLQAKLAKMGTFLGFLALLACILVFFAGLLIGIPVVDILSVSISLAVSAIPEGLPAVVTIVLSIGVQRMAKRNAIIRRLPAVETLGSASVICSDKTGTLTQNKMSLVKAYSDKQKKLEKISKSNSETILEILKFAVLCSNASVDFSNGKEKRIGDPTEVAIVVSAHLNGIEKSILDSSYKRIFEIPFDSSRKLMTTIVEINGKNIVIVKGAFDILAKKCIKGDIDSAKKQNDLMSKDALRVIGVAFKEIEEINDNTLTSEKLENNLTFMGLLGMIDPPRLGAKKAVNTCIKAGIKPVMITGDHISTASAIAKELGILDDNPDSIIGISELSKMSDEELSKKVKNISVYARVSPEDKIRIVNAWKRQGEVVAMTGDGVNDAPALKAADIGCAMGITGTDVAKNAADMILTDDNFSTIVHAIRQGRGIYDNIKKVISFLLSTNIGEVLAIVFSMILCQQVSLTSVQLLLVNLVTDGFPAIALGMEQIDHEIMLRKPKSRNESIFSNGAGFQIIFQGFLFGVITVLGFYHARNILGSIEAGQTMAFFTLAVSQAIQAFNMKSHRSLLKIDLFNNKKLNIAVLMSLIMVLVVTFSPANSIFNLNIIPWYFYLEGLILALVPTIFIEISKFFSLAKNKY